MNRTEFMTELRRQLEALPEQDRDKSLQFYREMIDDRILEDGYSEEEAVSALGSMDEIVAQIFAETPLPHFVKQNIRSRRPLGAGEILLLVLGAPLWIPLLVTVASLVLTAYFLLWVAVIVIFAVAVALLVSAGGCVVGGILGLVSGIPPLVLIGVILLCAGGGLLLFAGGTYAARGAAWLCRKSAVGLKRLVLKRSTK